MLLISCNWNNLPKEKAKLFNIFNDYTGPISVGDHFTVDVGGIIFDETITGITDCCVYVNIPYEYGTTSNSYTKSRFRDIVVDVTFAKNDSMQWD